MLSAGTCFLPSSGGKCARGDWDPTLCRTVAAPALQGSTGPVALRTVPSRGQPLSLSQQQDEQEALTHSEQHRAKRSTYFSPLSGTCAGCTSILTRSPCLPAERGAGTEQDVSIHAAHPTCRKSPFIQHNPPCRAQELPKLGLQQSGAPFRQFPDQNPYPEGDFYPVFHALLQHK